jgi:hypothetical protein
MAGRNIRCPADLDDPVAVYRQSPILNNPAIGVDGDDRPMKQQQALHRIPLLFGSTRSELPG